LPQARNGDTPLQGEQLLRVSAIATGGALGTLARYGVDRALAGPALGFPWSTLVVNMAGSFLLGAAVTVMVERWSPTRFARPFVAIGFCGGFTTFSTMVVEAAQRGQHGRVGLATLYLAVSLVAGLLAAAAGIGLARGRLLPAGPEESFPDPDDVGMLGDRPPAAPSARPGHAGDHPVGDR
jgi:CrcB protein